MGSTSLIHVRSYTCFPMWNCPQRAALLRSRMSHYPQHHPRPVPTATTVAYLSLMHSEYSLDPCMEKLKVTEAALWAGRIVVAWEQSCR
mmetsp:Transcript_7902/g.29241  ORF Transcript_7902/g.29241 Transcript_7902/m.29241 type:complete len:89 (-) Transcript_7902:13-279(-)